MHALPGVAYLCRFDEFWTMDFVSPGALELTGYPAEAFLAGGSVAFADIIHPDDRERVTREVEKAMANDRPFRLEYRIVRADGRLRWVLEVGHGVRQEEGELLGLEGILLDITERRDLEAQFRQSQKMEAVGRLAGSLAHDFNNLLTVIGANAQFLLEDLEDLEAGEALREEAREVAQAAKRAADLTAQLMTFARVKPQDPRAQDLNEVVRDLEGLMRRLMTDDVSFTLRLAPELPPVLGNRGQLEQVLMNLAVNAREAGPAGGAVTVETVVLELTAPWVGRRVNLDPGRWVLLTFSDNGAGMPLEALERVFEPFFTTKPEGTGLGLSTVFGIVRQHGGRISVYSEQGMGTTFKLYFPAATGESAPSPEGPEARLEELRGTESLLLVEDDSVVHEMGVAVLEQFGYRVASAGDVESALSLASSPAGEKLCLAIVDLVLQGESGVRLAGQLRAIRPECRILFTSGYPRNSLMDQGLLERGSPFIEKPFTPRSLLEQVRAALDGTHPGTSD